MTGIAAAVDALEVLSDTSFSWLGQRDALTIPALERASDQVRRRALLQRISLRLYNDYYTVGSPRPSRARTRGRGRRLARQLADANTGRGSFDGCWTVCGHDAGQIVVERSGLRLWVDRADVRATGSSDDPEIGQDVAIRWGRDAPNISPGFYMAISDQGLGAPRPQPLDRFYLNVRATSAAELMRYATRRLNEAGLAFRLKIVDDPDGFDRCDTAVLVVQRRDREASHPEAVAIHRAMRGHLSDETPAMARRLGNGFAFAEDPGNGKSFGTHRCDLIAQGIIDAHIAGARDARHRLEFVRERFRAAGVSLDAPHVTTGSRAAGAHLMFEPGGG